MYLDDSNSTVVKLLEELKTAWIKTFTDPADFPTEGSALRTVLDTVNNVDFVSRVRCTLEHEEIHRNYKLKLVIVESLKQECPSDSNDWLKIIRNLVRTQDLAWHQDFHRLIELLQAKILHN